MLTGNIVYIKLINKYFKCLSFNFQSGKYQQIFPQEVKVHSDP